MKFLLVFLGGGLGSMLRYGVSKYLNSSLIQFPFGTFTVNIVGSLLIGFLLGLSIKYQGLNEAGMVFLAVGFCGGFTTFSAFAFENFELLKNGAISQFILYTLLSLVIGILMVGLGILVSRLF